MAQELRRAPRESWLPFKGVNLKRSRKGFRFKKKFFRVFDRDYLGDQAYGDGCFSQDALGDWYLCLPVKVPVETTLAPQEAVGIDLGLKTIATTSDGETLEAGRWVHEMAPALATAQRYGNRQKARRLHVRGEAPPPGYAPSIQSEDSQPVSVDLRGRCEQPETREDRNGQIRAG